MKKPSDERPGEPYGDFRGYVLGYLPKIGLTASTVTMEGPHSIRVAARGGTGEGVLLIALKHTRKVGVHPLMGLGREMAAGGFSRGIFLSTSGYTLEASEYGLAHDMTLIAPGQSAEASAIWAQGQKTDSRNIFERVFASSMDDAAAKAFFEKERHRPIMGLIGRDERIDSIEGRFAPVGCFALGRAGGASNRFFVNLSSCNLYYIYRGIRGNEVNLRFYELLHRIMDLNQNSLRILSDAVEWQELNLSRLDPKYHGFLQENYNNVLTLQNRGLIGMSRDGGSILSNVNLKPFRDERYDLGRFLAEEPSVESRNPVDAVAYAPTAVLHLLSGLLQAEGEFKGVTYMPYYTCRYASADGTMRTLAYDSVKPKN
ncbi:MAG: restriction endonuclease [Candidatus Altiarchaeota archaeon]